MDRRIDPVDRELRPLARSTSAAARRRSPGSARCSASPSPPRSARSRGFDRPGKLIGYAGLAPRVSQSGSARDRRALQGRLEDASLGGGRGRQPGLAARQPMARPLPAGERAARQEPGEVLGRPQAPDRRLAHAEPRRALQASRPRAREHCPGELLLLSDRPTVLHGIERPRQLPGTICAPSAEREMSTPHPPTGSGTSTPITAGRSPP